MTTNVVLRYDAPVSVARAHDIRKLRVCQACGGIGAKDGMVDHMHGRCYIATNGLAALIALPRDVTSGLTLGDIGPVAMKALIESWTR